MQKMLTSVEAWPNPSVMLPAGAPVSVIVWAPPPAGPKAPGLACWQSGHAPLPSGQAIGRPPISRDPGGGQSWLVGKPALIGESAGTQGAPLLPSVVRV